MRPLTGRLLGHAIWPRAGPLETRAITNAIWYKHFQSKIDEIKTTLSDNSGPMCVVHVRCIHKQTFFGLRLICYISIGLSYYIYIYIHKLPNPVEFMPCSFEQLFFVVPPATVPPKFTRLKSTMHCMPATYTRTSLIARSLHHRRATHLDNHVTTSA